MSLGLTNYQVGVPNDVSSQCSHNPTQYSKAIYSNLKWSSADANLDQVSADPQPDLKPKPEPKPEPEPEPVLVSNAAPKLSDCEEGCTECLESYWDNAPDQKTYQCLDKTVYKYGEICSETDDQTRCATDRSDQFCHMSHPIDDVDGF